MKILVKHTKSCEDKVRQLLHHAKHLNILSTWHAQDQDLSTIRTFNKGNERTILMLPISIKEKGKTQIFS